MTHQKPHTHHHRRHLSPKLSELAKLRLAELRHAELRSSLTNRLALTSVPPPNDTNAIPNLETLFVAAPREPSGPLWSDSERLKIPVPASTFGPSREQLCRESTRRANS